MLTEGQEGARCSHRSRKEHGAHTGAGRSTVLIELLLSLFMFVAPFWRNSRQVYHLKSCFVVKAIQIYCFHIKVGFRALVKGICIDNFPKYGQYSALLTQYTSSVVSC